MLMFSSHPKSSGTYARGKTEGNPCRGFFLSFALLAALPAGQIAAVEFEGTLSYHTRYMLEGYDVLDAGFERGEGGIATLVLNVSQETRIGDFFAEAALYATPSEDYREAEVILGFGRSLGDFSGSLFFSRFFIEADYGTGDEVLYYNEYTATLSYDAWEAWTPGIEFVYSDLNYGELLVVSLEGEFEVHGVTLVPYVLADFDFDYVSDEYDGLNHVQAGVSWPMPFPGGRELTAYISYSIAGGNLRRDEALDHDLLWAGISLPL